jgi:hypothetical protein
MSATPAINVLRRTSFSWARRLTRLGSPAGGPHIHFGACILA